MPKIKLQNGLTIANFSSGHVFIFDDGSVLPACEDDRVETLMLESVDEEVKNFAPWKDIRKKFKMNDTVKKAVRRATLAWGIDVVLVPLPVLEAIKSCGMSARNCRVVCTKDRVKKIIYSGRFCV